MVHKIVFQLTEESINDAIIQLENEKQKILGTIHSLMELLMEEGITIAKSQVDNVDSGLTRNSIEGMFINNEKAVIIAGGNAVWLEFGTGVLRNPSAYPDQVEGIVPVGTYGSGRGSNLDGWIFPTRKTKYVKKKNGRYPKFKGGEWDGMYIGHTKGIKANKFMLYAKEHLTSIAPGWAIDLFSSM